MHLPTLARHRRHARLTAQVIAVALVAFAAACSDFLDPDECRHLNALPDTASMHVGETRVFEAAGFQEGNRSGACVGTIRFGFNYRSTSPSVATVDASTGEVTAHSPGTTTISAHRDNPKRDGYLKLQVLAAP